MMRMLSSGLILVLAASAAQADPSVVTLSPEARSAALEAAARQDEALPLNGDPRKIHGEIGMEVGTGGHRALWGSTTVPLGQTGSASVAFLTSQGSGWRR